MEATKEKIAHVNALRDKAEQLKLLGYEGLVWSMSAVTLAEIYNGAGADWMSERFRSRLTKLLALFEPAFLVHDRDFWCSNGTREGFDEANDRLEFNCLKIANAAYPLAEQPLRRIRAREAALAIGEACRLGAWKAWLDAARKMEDKR